MAGITLSDASLAKLKGVHPDLVRVVKRAATITRQDFTVTEGVRTRLRQHELYGHGRAAAELKAKGVDPAFAQPKLPKVTWVTVSNHFIASDGYGHAIDAPPYPIDWADTPANLKRFDAVAAAMFEAARLEGVAIRWGADWDGDGKPRERGESDSPHFELHR